jgi:hypothetical protein
MKKILSLAAGIALAIVTVPLVTSLLAAPITVPTQASRLPTYGTALSNTVGIAHVTTNVVNAKVITLYPGRGVALSPRVVGTQSTNTGLVAFFWQLQVDGTNWSTTTPIVTTTTANATTAVRDWSYIPASTLGNASAMRLLKITNALGNMDLLYVSNVVTIIDSP